MRTALSPEKPCREAVRANVGLSGFWLLASATSTGRGLYRLIGTRLFLFWVAMMFDTDSPGDPDGLDTYEHLFLSGQQVIETREGSGSTAAQAESLQPKFYSR